MLLQKQLPGKSLEREKEEKSETTALHHLPWARQSVALSGV